MEMIVGLCKNLKTLGRDFTDTKNFDVMFNSVYLGYIDPGSLRNFSAFAHCHFDRFDAQFPFSVQVLGLWLRWIDYCMTLANAAWLEGTSASICQNRKTNTVARFRFHNDKAANFTIHGIAMTSFFLFIRNICIVRIAGPSRFAPQKLEKCARFEKFRGLNSVAYGT
jgi:hypothetical protein